MLNETRGFWKYILFTIITLGIYQAYIIYAFAKETNIACKSDNKHTRGLLAFFLLSMITFGIYALVWNILLVNRRANFLDNKKQYNNLSVGFYLLSIFLGPLTLGILTLIGLSKYIRQQNLVNAYYNTKILKS